MGCANRAEVHAFRAGLYGLVVGLPHDSEVLAFLEDPGTKDDRLAGRLFVQWGDADLVLVDIDQPPQLQLGGRVRAGDFTSNTLSCTRGP
jgi:hypothetical protein